MAADQMKPLGKPIAIGRTAEIFAWDDGTILKLYREWCPPNWIEHEAYIAQKVNQAGVPSPKVGEIVTVDGRRGIIYERVDGIDMMIALKLRMFGLVGYARTLAQLHIAMHNCPISGLPSQRESLIRSIRSAKSLPEDLRQPALQQLENLPDASMLCHGDFHPGNVILTPRGPVVIDWMTATQGHPAADVARTRLILTVGDAPQGGILRLVILLGRSLYVRSYLQIYASQSPGVVEQSKAFMPVQAAARLNEEIAPEREKLLKVIESSLARPA